MIIKDFFFIYIPFLIIIATLHYLLKNILAFKGISKVLNKSKKKNRTVSIINSIAEKLGRKFGKYLMPFYERRLLYIKKFLNINDPFDEGDININTFMGYKIFLCFLVPLTGIAISDGILLFCFILLLGIPVVFFIPDIIVGLVIAGRKQKIKEEVPYISDLLYLSTACGQNIYNSLKMIGNSSQGFISDHFKRFINYIDSGLDRETSYKKIIEDSYSEELNRIFFVLNQAQRHGSSLREILLENSRFLRFEIEQDNESRARRSSVLIIFPLVFLILPSFLFLVGGPFIVSIGQDLFVFQ